MAIDVFIGIVGAILVLAAGFAFGRSNEKQRLEALGQGAQDLTKKAEAEASALKEKHILDAQKESQVHREKLESEFQERRIELRDLEKRLNQKEEFLERKAEQLNSREERFAETEGELRQDRKELDTVLQEARSRLEEVAGLTSDEAKERLFKEVEKENQVRLNRSIRQAEETAREEADRRARKIVTTAIQKWSAETVVESTVSVVNLPNDEMKGRIIGREGRNIRMLEGMTGVDLIIDDTPEAVLLSCFDPIRREVARLALEGLVADGRIHPARIEEMVDKARKELDMRVVEEGETATIESGITGLHPELVKYLGRLRFRTSYGQNIMFHSLEVSFLAAQMAAELGADIEVAQRAGLLHDIGKAVTAEIEGPHAIVGARLCKKYGENDAVVHAVEAHHEDVEQKTVEAVLVQAADAISAARPGARRENVETYVKRLERLEVLANEFEGVDMTYAVQAGREVRILVRPDEVDDAGSARLARAIASRIEEELQYPGQIKVTVIRETRASEQAK